MFRICEAKNGTEIEERLQAVASRHKKYDKMVKRVQVPGWQGLRPRRRGTGRLKNKKRRFTRKGYQRLLNKFEMEGFMAQAGSVESRQR